MIRKAGIALIAKHGFEAMNLRELAEVCGFQGAGSLYNHFESKDEFLFRVMCEIMQEILADFDAEVAPIEGAAPRLRAFVVFHINWQTQRRQATFVSNMEMRSLSATSRRAYVALRRQYEDRVAQILCDGCEDGSFQVADIRMATLALISMITGVSTWFHRRGRLSRRRVTEIYVQMALAMVAHPASRAASQPAQGRDA